MIDHYGFGLGGVTGKDGIDNIAMLGIGLQDLVIRDQNAELQPIDAVGNAAELFRQKRISGDIGKQHMEGKVVARHGREVIAGLGTVEFGLNGS